MTQWSHCAEGAHNCPGQSAPCAAHSVFQAQGNLSAAQSAPCAVQSAHCEAQSTLCAAHNYPAQSALSVGALHCAQQSAIHYKFLDQRQIVVALCSKFTEHCQNCTSQK